MLMLAVRIQRTTYTYSAADWEAPQELNIPFKRRGPGNETIEPPEQMNEWWLIIHIHRAVVVGWDDSGDWWLTAG